MIRERQRQAEPKYPLWTSTNLHGAELHSYRRKVWGYVQLWGRWKNHTGLRNKLQGDLWAIEYGVQCPQCEGTDISYIDVSYIWQKQTYIMCGQCFSSFDFLFSVSELFQFFLSMGFCFDSFLRLFSEICFARFGNRQYKTTYRNMQAEKKKWIGRRAYVLLVSFLRAPNNFII